MSVLEGEGRVPIIFGSLSLPEPPHRPAYIARPDLGGEFTTVVVAPDESGVTPAVKALAQHLARWGYAVIVPEMRSDFDAAVRDLTDAVDSARIPGTEWASPERIALVAIGSGGSIAPVVAAEERVPALVMVSATLDRDLLAAAPGALLVFHGADDEAAPADEVKDMREDLGRGEWILYRGVGSDFFDDASPTFDAGASDDVRDRLVSFLDTRFGAVAPA